MILDAHNHAIPHAVLDLYRAESRLGVAVEDGRWRGAGHVEFELTRSFFDPTAKLADLAADGLDGAVVSLAPTDLHYDVDAELGAALAQAANTGLAEMAASAPDRLAWLATVPLQAPSEAAAVLERAVADGARGVQVGTSVAGGRLDEPRFDPFWAAADGLEALVMVHPAYNEPNASLEDYYLGNVIGNQLETTVAVERLICAGVLDRYPRVELLLVHGGGYFPWQAGRLRHARSVRPELRGAPPDPWSYVDRMWFDTITHDPAVLAALIDRVGAERMLLGTDRPFDMAAPAPVAQLQGVAAAHVVEQISRRNPARAFGFGSRSADGAARQVP
jgi:aminocarboxymuconate-semialdehyde decarboxylase